MLAQTGRLAQAKSVVGEGRFFVSRATTRLQVKANFPSFRFEWARFFFFFFDGRL
jgi:hypothetical protein